MVRTWLLLRLALYRREPSIRLVFGIVWVGLWRLFQFFIPSVVGLTSIALLNLELAILAEDLVASLALERHVREVSAHDAFDLISEFPLKLILNLCFFDVNLRDWIGAHELIHGHVG